MPPRELSNGMLLQRVVHYRLILPSQSYIRAQFSQVKCVGGWIARSCHRNIFRVRLIVCGAFICHRPIVDALFP